MHDPPVSSVMSSAGRQLYIILAGGEPSREWDGGLGSRSMQDDDTMAWRGRHDYYSIVRRVLLSHLSGRTSACHPS